ncbi:hypothetical protein GGS21DRAFT_502325 [Xylaria nigripes]|nr:hypothetical protein GGS21DRAFT_502325 [Xylaria nigripes]
MSIIDGKRRAGVAWSPEQTSLSTSSPALPSRNTTQTRTGPILTEGSQNSSASFLPESPGLVAEDDVPPAYSEFHDQLDIHQAGFDAGAEVTDDGRVNININQTSRRLADFIAPTLRSQLTYFPESLPPPYIPPSLGGQPGQTPPPRLNIVIQIVGSRGDVQPFIALGQVLKNTYGHRVRVATHATFQKFVEENGLEFFSIGGNPAELMAFMVKHPGLMPGLDALKNGEIAKRRKGIGEIIMGCWRSCIETGDGLGPAPQFSGKDNDGIYQVTPLTSDPKHKTFVADAIIANPPSFAHVHVAEKLGVPLHLMFTMPWSPTRAFPQPLANIQSNTDPVTTNYLSYAMVEMMTWQGLGDVINRFRTKVLDLEPLALIWAPAVLTRLRIPYTYCWSPALIPKPNDWGNHIDIAGFYFLNLASSYTPEPELSAFLASGPPPIYVGFGSIVVDDPNELTKTIFDAVAETGVRALVSKGWGGLGADSIGIPDGVFMLGNVPHDWLFQHVSAVCHHGGAGTTAAGIQAGKPTIVVPFFGDQPFWGAMVARAGAGPDPIPFKKLTSQGLADAIRIALKPETQEKAKQLGEKISLEKGVDVGAQSFHQHLNVDTLRCAVTPSRVAVWRVRRSKTHLSALAAATLVNSGYVQYSDLKLFRAKEYETENYPTDPISACTSALVSDITSVFMSAADIPRDLFKTTAEPPQSKATENVSAGGISTQSSGSTKATSSSVGGPASLFPNVLGQSTINSSAQDRTTTSPAKKTGIPLPDTSTNHLERVLDTSKSINNIIATGMKSPMNFCMGLARGFRNAPNLYNDDTIRPTEKVTSFSSGLKVAGKEFGLGMYDGITGLITQPLKGAEKEGGAGLLKGFGKGIGGLILKPSAAVWALPAYTMAGIHAEIRNMFSQSAHRYIVASRIAQGNEEFKNSSAAEREDIEARWLSLRDKMKGFYLLKQKEKGKSRDVLSSVSEDATDSREDLTGVPRADWLQSRNPSTNERQRLQEWKTPGVSNADNTHVLGDEFESAIQTAVRETSRGNAVEDSRIENAIRSSLDTIGRQSTMGSSASSNLKASSTGQHPLGWARDVKHSIPEERLANSLSADDLEGITDEEYQSLIEEAIKLSIADDSQLAIRMHDLEEEGNEEAVKAVQSSHSKKTVYGDDDEEYQKALEASQVEYEAQEHHQHKDADLNEAALRHAIQASQADLGQHQPSEDEELKRALEESERAHKEELARINSLKSEEDMVMEYVKQQSLAEVAFHNTNAKNVEEDEELRRVLEESMKTDDGLRRGRGGGPSHS